MNEWPNTLYRLRHDGFAEGKTFARPEDVPSSEGWKVYDELGRPSIAKGPIGAAQAPLPDNEAVSAGKRLVSLELENGSLKDTLKLYEDEAKLKDARIAELEAKLSPAEPATPPAEKKKRAAKA